jgi:hypothetical protein
VHGGQCMPHQVTLTEGQAGDAHRHMWTKDSLPGPFLSFHRWVEVMGPLALPGVGGAPHAQRHGWTLRSSVIGEDGPPDCGVLGAGALEDVEGLEQLLGLGKHARDCM